MRALGNSYIPEVLLEISYVLLIPPETCPVDPNIATRETFVKKTHPDIITAVPWEKILGKAFQMMRRLFP